MQFCLYRRRKSTNGCPEIAVPKGEKYSVDKFYNLMFRISDHLVVKAAESFS
jgi:hypothetical protein